MVGPVIGLLRDTSVGRRNNQRVMDGLMAIPGVLLAIALISWRASLTNVIIAISIPEIPRVVRLVRRRANDSGTAVCRSGYLSRFATIENSFKHILPNTVAPLIVQATYVCASAVVEAIQVIFGAGPTGNSAGHIMAEGRTYFQIAP